MSSAYVCIHPSANTRHCTRYDAFRFGMVLSLASAPTLVLLMVLVILLIMEFFQFSSPNHEFLLPTNSVCTPVVIGAVLAAAVPAWTQDALCRALAWSHPT